MTERAHLIHIGVPHPGVAVGGPLVFPAAPHPGRLEFPPQGLISEEHPPTVVVVDLHLSVVNHVSGEGIPRFHNPQYIPPPPAMKAPQRGKQ